MLKEKNTIAADGKPAATPPETETVTNAEPGTTVPDRQTEAATSDTPAQADRPDTEADDKPDTDELIRRAYLRGRNEAIDELMRRPAMLQPLDTASASRPDSAPASEIMILNSQRPSIWDK